MSFVPEKSINFSPTLAVTIGLEEAILLQLLQECLSHNNIRMEDALRWTSLKEEKLLELAPFWKTNDIMRYMSSLQAKGILLLREERRYEVKSYSFAFNEYKENREISTLDKSDSQKASTIYRLTTSQQSDQTIKNDWRPGADCLRQLYPVSYTHLTLPTKRIV